MHPRLFSQRGLTLVELMVSLALGLLVVLAATALLQQARAAYQDIDDAARVQETGRMALAHLADALRQAGHLPPEATPVDGAPIPAPGVAGFDDSRDADAIDPPAGALGARSGNGYNKSDMLALGYFGAPAASGATISNCSGAAIAGASLQADARNWVVYYIAPGTGNEPELRCRYRAKAGDGGWTSGAVARGVEAMQLQYGVDTNLDGRADRWLDASAIAGAQWRQVRLVRIALLVRGERRRPAPAGAPPRTYRLFDANTGGDAWRYTEKDGEQRLRTVFRATIFLRNMQAPP